jgi:hypothetical protein
VRWLRRLSSETQSSELIAALVLYVVLAPIAALWFYVGAAEPLTTVEAVVALAFGACTGDDPASIYVVAGAADEGRDVARPSRRPGMENQFVGIRFTSLRRATAPALQERDGGAPAAGLPKLGLALVAERRQLVSRDQ